MVQYGAVKCIVVLCGAVVAGEKEKGSERGGGEEDRGGKGGGQRDR